MEESYMQIDKHVWMYQNIHTTLYKLGCFTWQNAKSESHSLTLQIKKLQDKHHEDQHCLLEEIHGLQNGLEEKSQVCVWYCCDITDEILLLIL